MKPMKYRKKQSEIEAIQNIVGRAETISTWMKLLGCEPIFDGASFSVRTPEGKWMADRGDWITLSTRGEFRFIKSSIFDATYEPVVTWQPIDTAPADGSRILISDRTQVYLGYWTGSRWAIWGGDGVIMWPTHWMPLPEPAKVSLTATPKAGIDGLRKACE